jgi:hypothetical protein
MGCVLLDCVGEGGSLLDDSALEYQEVDMSPIPSAGGIERDDFRRHCLNGLEMPESKRWRWLFEPGQPMNAICRGCKKPVGADDFVVWHTYWKAYWAPAHKACLEEGLKEEAYLCQCIDADCNDCRYFDRGPRVASGVFEGVCKVTGVKVVGRPNFATGRPCFAHRRDGVTA